MLAAAVLCAACGGGGSDSSNQQQTPDRAPKRGGTLTVLWTNDVALIDCGATYYQMDWFLCWSTQRPLYNYKPGSVNMVPDLATGEPEVSADAKTVTVKLRTGVKFSPPVNREVTSADVKYAIERGFFRTVNTGYASIYFGDVEGAEPGVKPGTKIAGIEAPDPQTIVFHLTKPTGGVLAAGALALPLTAPVPEEYAAPFDAKEPSVYGQHQVATGPYMIANDAQGNATGYKPQRGVHLVRNPSWDASTDYKPAYLDEIENVMGNGDTGVASRKILDGRSMATGDFSPPPDVLKQALTTRKSQLITTPSTGGRWISMNTTIKPFDDLNVRKAVLAGFDRNALRLTRGGEPAGVIATHFLSPTIAGFSEAGGDKGAGVRLPRRQRQAQPAALGRVLQEGRLPVRQIHRRREAADGRRQHGRRRARRRGHQAAVRGHGLQGHAAAGRHRDRVRALLQRAEDECRGVPERRPQRRLLGWADAAGPELQRRQHRAGQQHQLAAAERPRRSTRRWRRRRSSASRRSAPRRGRGSTAWSPPRRRRSPGCGTTRRS